MANLIEQAINCNDGERAAKIIRDALGIESDDTLGDAVKILDMHRIGAVVITGTDRQILGILSERDVVRTFAHNARVAGGCQFCDEPVERVMTREVASCKQSDTVYELMERMTTGRFRHVPVIEDGGLAGIVSIGNVVKHRVAEMASESNALRLERLFGTPATEAILRTTFRSLRRRSNRCQSGHA